MCAQNLPLFNDEGNIFKIKMWQHAMQPRSSNSNCQIVSVDLPNIHRNRVYNKLKKDKKNI